MRVCRSVCVAALLGVFGHAWGAGGQQQVSVGLGEYFATPPGNFEIPRNSQGQPVSPRVSASFNKPVPANEWWSSLIWNRNGGPYGGTLHPQPFSVQGVGAGVAVGHRDTAFAATQGYNFGFNAGLAAVTLGTGGVSNGTMRVEDYGDWHVEASWTQGGSSLTATIARGSPFIYVRANDARVSRPFETAVTFDLGNVIGLRREGVFYGLFAPPGTDWSMGGFTLTNDLGSDNVYSFAVLPDGSLQTLQRFAEHAFAFVTDTRVSWAYAPEKGVCDVTFEFETEAVIGSETTPLVALYRHQWLNTQQPTEAGYNTSRGEMRLSEASSFVCEFPLRGVLPGLADVGAMPTGTLGTLVQQVSNNPRPGNPSDTYFQGKTFGRAATALTLAEQAGRFDVRNALLDYLRDSLAEWFSIGAVDDPDCDPGGAYGENEAESFDELTGGNVIAINGGSAVAGLGGDSVLRYDAVNFSSGTPTRLRVRVASNSFFTGLLQARIDSPTGPIVAEGAVGGPGDIDSYAEVVLPAQSGAALATGVHDLFLIVDSPFATEIVRIDSWRFDGADDCSSTPPSLDQSFSYNPQWDTVVGNPASFELGTSMNDHHFHYGYFVHGAAAIAQRDPLWASQERYGGMVELLIRDVANWDRTDTEFPFLRNFDPYRGHGYASGHGDSPRGNNQEASSESTNFSQACVLWGSITGNTEIRDLGIFLLATEAAAIQQYWFDADQAVFPPQVQHDVTGILWDDGAEYATFFSGEPELIQGINQLPITGGHLYLGDRPDAVVRNYNLLESINGGRPEFWTSLLWTTLAFGDPDRALNLINTVPGYEIELGDSRARSEFWIRTIAQTGPLALDLTADSPHATAFEKDGVVTYTVFNPLPSTQRVTFSDGNAFDVAGGELVALTAEDAVGDDCPADVNNDGNLDGADFNAWLAAFAAGAPAADQNNDGNLDGADFNAWLANFAAGCD